MAFNKNVHLFVAALAAMTQATGTPIIPAWCSCGDIMIKTKTACGQAAIGMAAPVASPPPPS
ncbi:hypothetical protein BGZ65_012487, partial [Modicella reniformis]